MQKLIRIEAKKVGEKAVFTIQEVRTDEGANYPLSVDDGIDMAVLQLQLLLQAMGWEVC